jgi:hypothetical protein
VRSWIGQYRFDSLRRGLLTVVLVVGAVACYAEPVDLDGQRLARFLDSLDVEHHWPAGVHVQWESGIPDDRPGSSFGEHSHCSAFVAAAAKRLGIYILRPPQHSQELLANAQYDWLESASAYVGWQKIDGPQAAQAAANHGEFVVAAYRNHFDDKPGHIAIVRPSEKDDAAIASEGPQITQAGGQNYQDTSVRIGFAGHPAAWGRSELRYYAHAVNYWP